MPLLSTLVFTTFHFHLDVLEQNVSSLPSQKNTLLSSYAKTPLFLKPNFHYLIEIHDTLTIKGSHVVNHPGDNLTLTCDGLKTDNVVVYWFFGEQLMLMTSSKNYTWTESENYGSLCFKILISNCCDFFRLRKISPLVGVK